MIIVYKYDRSFVLCANIKIQMVIQIYMCFQIASYDMINMSYKTSLSFLLSLI